MPQPNLTTTILRNKNNRGRLFGDKEGAGGYIHHEKEVYFDLKYVEKSGATSYNPFKELKRSWLQLMMDFYADCFILSVCVEWPCAGLDVVTGLVTGAGVCVLKSSLT